MNIKINQRHYTTFVQRVKSGFMFQLLSYNVNGIRAAIKKGLFSFLKNNDFDVICLQELKAEESQLEEDEMVKCGYHRYFNSAQKKGYAGVGTYCKHKANEVIDGCGVNWIDQEGRIQTLIFNAYVLVNVYMPSGSNDEKRQELKFDFLNHFYDWIVELQKRKLPILIVGDFNICHQAMDIHQPKMSKKTPGFTLEEQSWVTKLLELGFVDGFRSLHPDKQCFSWWSYRTKARERNKGWRIDYGLVDEAIIEELLQADYLSQEIHSDHCPHFLCFKSNLFG